MNPSLNVIMGVKLKRWYQKTDASQVSRVFSLKHDGERIHHHLEPFSAEEKRIVSTKARLLFRSEDHSGSRIERKRSAVQVPGQYPPSVALSSSRRDNEPGARVPETQRNADGNQQQGNTDAQNSRRSVCNHPRLNYIRLIARQIANLSGGSELPVPALLLQHLLNRRTKPFRGKPGLILLLIFVAVWVELFHPK